LEPGADKNQRTRDEDVFCTQAHFLAVALVAALVLLTSILFMYKFAAITHHRLTRKFITGPVLGFTIR
jgi:uncharacterized membrane protein